MTPYQKIMEMYKNAEWRFVKNIHKQNIGLENLDGKSIRDPEPVHMRTVQELKEFGYVSVWEFVCEGDIIAKLMCEELGKGWRVDGKFRAVKEVAGCPNEVIVIFIPNLGLFRAYTNKQTNPEKYEKFGYWENMGTSARLAVYHMRDNVQSDIDNFQERYANRFNHLVLEHLRSEVKVWELEREAVAEANREETMKWLELSGFWPNKEK